MIFWSPIVRVGNSKVLEVRGVVLVPMTRADADGARNTTVFEIFFPGPPGMMVLSFMRY